MQKRQEVLLKFIITQILLLVNTLKEIFMRDLIFELEKVLLQHKVITQLIGLLAISAESKIPLNDFKEGIFFMYKLSIDNNKEFDVIWQDMLSIINED